MAERATRRSARGALLAALACSAPCAAIDRITLQAEQVQISGARLDTVQATLQVTDAAHSVATLQAGNLLLPGELQAQTGALASLRVTCADPLVDEPRFGCPQLTARLQSARLGVLAVNARLDYRSDRGALQAAGSGPALAGSALRWQGQAQRGAWSARAQLPVLQVAALRNALRPWLPAALQAQLEALQPVGSVAANAQLQGSDARLTSMQATASITGLGLQNAAATLIAEKLAARLQVSSGADWRNLHVDVQGSAGQLLAGPVLLDFTVNPLQLQADAQLTGSALQLTRVAFAQRGLSSGGGHATLSLQAPIMVTQAELNLASLQFPAAYASFLQLPLSTTAFGTLAMSGSARGSIAVRDNLPQRADLTLTDIALHDPARRIAVTGLSGRVRWWRGTQTGPPAPSLLQWDQATVLGIEAGAARLEFLAHDRDFEFLQPVRLPLFDGAVRVERLVARGIGTDALQGAFEAQLEPISMARICRAFGWPEFQGQLSGRVPGLEYRDQLLTLGGNLEARVFDGSIVASRLRVRDPLGAWPRLYADIVARNLDLNLVTSTFEFGSITGRLDADVIGLETFNWSPVAFDARLATPPGDRSTHRISQKAVTNLSNIGGGGGGVTAALQSGMLRFFDTFRYDRIGLTCRLQNDVCIMGGVAAAKQGYYIVKGSGIPRIDIIGNAHRVDWPTLMAQLIAGMDTENIVVK